MNINMNMVKSTTPVADTVTYLKVPAAWTDTRATRPKLVKAIVARFGEGWQVERIGTPQDDGKRLIRLVRDGDLDPLPGLGRETLIDDVSDTKAKVFDARYRRAGNSLVSWDPADRICHFAALTPTARELRDRLALILKVKPWDLEVAPHWGLNALSGEAEVQRVVVSRAPEIGTGEKRRETWTEAFTALYPLERGASWVFTADAMAGSVVMTRRPDPLRLTLFAGEFVENPVGVPVATIGRSEHADGPGADLTLDLGAMATHMAVQGQTRSGKSIFAYQLLTSLSASKSVIIAGADPSGILLAPFRGTRHESWQATGTQRPEAVLEMLDKLTAEMDARTVAIADELTDKIETFTPERPLIVVALEEFPGLRRSIEAADAAAVGEGGPKVKMVSLFDLGVSRLAAEGAKVGIRLLIMAQRLEGGVLKTGDRANMPTRISFRVDKAEAITMLHESLPVGLDVERVRNFPPGVGLYESAVADQRVVRFRGPYLDGGYPEYVRRIRLGSPLLVDPSTVEIEPEIIELAELEFSLEDLETFTVDDEPPVEGFDTDLAAVDELFPF